MYLSIWSLTGFNIIKIVSLLTNSNRAAINEQIRINPKTNNNDFVLYWILLYNNLIPAVINIPDDHSTVLSTNLFQSFNKTSGLIISVSKVIKITHPNVLIIQKEG